MSELSHDTADDGFHEIQLSGKQLVFLFIVTTVVSVAIFLCGVLVGRGARAARGEDAEPSATAAAAPAAPQPVADAGPPAAEPPAPAAETPDELSYHKRLQGAGAAPETMKPQRGAAGARADAARRRRRRRRRAPPRRRRPTSPTAGRPGTWVVQVIAHARSDRSRAPSSSASPARAIRHSSSTPRPAPRSRSSRCTSAATTTGARPSR